MDNQLHPETENQLHPELAFQIGIPQETKKYEVHPSLQVELEAQEESVSPEPDQAIINTAQQAPQNPPVEQSQEKAPETTKDRNWRELRAQTERAKQIEREAQEIARERDFYREQAMRNQKTQEVDEDYRTETEKKLSKEMEELRALVARQSQETENAKRQSATARAEQRLAQDYPDIREIVTDENIQRLETEFPELYNSVIASSNIYSVGAAAYEMIIAKGIAQRVQKSNMNSYENVQKSNTNPNRNRPKSASTVSPQAGETPIQRAGNFMGNSISSEEERKALYAEMIASSRNKAF